MNRQAPLLQVQALKASYGNSQALFDVSFEVAEGEVVTLLGRNGMGRSTTVKCLFGMLAPQAGEIHVAGQRIDKMASHRIARLGLALVPEGRQVFPNLSVQENLVATARLGLPTALAPWTLSRVYAFFPRLAERRANLGSQLSGGEQQMLAIGRALMTNPRLLVLDEATEGLAPLLRQEIWDALSHLKADGLAQIVIDKNLKHLTHLADRHYVIEKGCTVWQGDSQALLNASDKIQAYLGI